MKVLAIHPGPAFSVADVHNGVCAGLSANGCEVVSFNLDDRIDFYSNAQIERGGELRKAFDHEAACAMAAQGLQAALYSYWPDVVIVMSGFFLPPDLYHLIRAHRHHLVLWCTESPYEDDRQLAMAHAADTVIVNDPVNIDQFIERNERTFYIPHGYDPAVHRPGAGKPEWDCDFSFVGTGYPSRVEFFEKVDFDGIRATFAGNWQNVTDDSPMMPMLAAERGHCIDNPMAAHLYRSSKVSANLYRKEAAATDLVDGWAMGPREVELAACGTFFLREPRSESDKVLWMLPSFDGPHDFGEQLRWWLARPEQRTEVATAARAAVEDRTFRNLTAGLLAKIA